MSTLVGCGLIEGAEVEHEGLVQEDRPLLVRSPLLEGVEGITHGFSTRYGGISEGPRRSLNLGRGVGDPASVVRENRQRVLQAMECTGHQWVSLQQVHGKSVVEVTRHARRNIEGDGLWTQDPQAAVAVTVADCVPILIAHRSGRAVAAVHAGWRGTEARIVGEMVKRLSAAGFKPNDLVAALGPAIGPQNFEIGAEVVASLQAAFPQADTLQIVEKGKGFANLWDLNTIALEEAGLMPSQIDVVAHCTVGSTDYFSYRREKGDTGRQCGIIACRS